MHKSILRIAYLPSLTFQKCSYMLLAVFAITTYLILAINYSKRIVLMENPFTHLRTFPQHA
jgi:hypothetical protein